MNQKESLINSLIEEGYLKSSLTIDAFRKIDRLDFVLPEYKDDAYGNFPLPIGSGQTISQPLTVAFMLELLDPQTGEKILDVGSGSGWQTALLAYVVSQPFTRESASGRRESAGLVVAIERIPELCDFAKKNIDKYGFIENGAVKFYCQDATAQIPNGPYDKIIAAAAASENLPDLWGKNLKIGGRIVAPIGGSVWLFIKKSEDEFEKQEFEGFTFVPLVKGGGLNTKSTKKERFLKRFYDWGGSPKFFLILVLLSVYFFAVFLNEVYYLHASYGGVKSVEIRPGMGSREIGKLLKNEGVIRSKWSFVTYVSLRGKASKLKPGVYLFGRETVVGIVEKLVRGGSYERTITIPEGWSKEGIISYFRDGDFSFADDFEKIVSQKGSKDFLVKFDFLKDKPDSSGLEGYLFPDTYRIFNSSTAEDVVVKFLENFDKKLTQELRDAIKKQNKKIFEIIITASLIEKEVISDEDRAMVSGILWKRLGAGIPLQVDATINYILQKANNQQPTTKISIEDTKIDSPYNTYKYLGLPPGPIANPGLSSIRAAIFQKISPYLYYLSAPDGKTIFSKTFEEHVAAKVKYLR